MNSTDAELKLSAKKGRGSGLKIPSIVGAHYEGASLASEILAKRSQERVKRLLHAGSVMGADTALVVAGGCSSTTENPYGQYDVVYEKLGQERGRARADRHGRGRADRH